MNGYANYYFAMHDRMDSQLTFNKDSVVVKVGNKTLVKDTDYKVVNNWLNWRNIPDPDYRFKSDN